MGNAVEEFFVSIPDTVRGLFRHDPSTRAASVEFWVVASTWLLLLKYAVGSIGPRMFSSRHVNPGVQLVRIFSHYSVAYSLGLMQPSSAVEGSASNDLFQVWAVLIVTMQDSVSIGRPYKPQEMSTVDLLTSLWSANQLRANTATYLKVPLWLIWSVHASRIIWYYVSSDGASGASADNMKLVGDYMASSQHATPDACPATMVGYKYLVLGEDEQEMQISTSSFKSELVSTRPEVLITVDKVWSHPDDKLLGSGSDDKFKDVCLSFALYKLLRRRFFDFPIPEAKDAAMRRLVSEGILVLDEKTKNYERAFRVTEVELSFLQDFSYSKHSVVFASGFPTQRLMLSLLMTSAAMYLAYAVRELPPAIDALTSGDRPARITHGGLVTRAIILIMVCRELWEIGVFILSQWTKVVIICHYIRLQQRPGWIPTLHRLMTEKVARIMFRVIRRGKWNENIQQYNLLMMAAPIEITKTGPFRSRSVKLQSDVRRTIFDSLKKVLKAAAPEKGSPSASAQRRSSDTLISHYKSAFADTNGPLLRSSIEDMHVKLKGDTHKILVWHVATSLCQIKLLEEAGSRGNLYSLETPAFADESDSDRELAAVWPDYITAASLSNYCAYLVTETLVPDNGLVAKTVFDRVRKEAGEDLAGCRTLTKIHRKLVEAAGKRDDQTEDLSIVEMGTKLAEMLMASYPDRGDLWKRLGRFWAAFLLHLSASTTAAKHRIHLQGNGELTTHLWALLSHAGFLGDTTHGQQMLDPVDLGAA